MGASPLVLAAARIAYGVGLSIIPVHEDGSKAPAVAWTKYQTERADPEQVRDWDFGQRTGLGVVTGFADLTMLESDDAALVNRFKDLAQASGLGELIERISAGYEEETPSGGVHWFYRCSEVRGNTTLAKRPQPDGKRKALMQTRGRGGYVVVAPSHGKVHPSGKPYRLLRGGFATIATITPEEQVALWALARSLDECLRPEDIRSTLRPISPASGDRPGDLFNAVATWDDILTPHGWTFVFQRGGVGYWRRPGKSEGISATTNWGGYDYFYPFTSSTEFDEERGYTRFSVYAYLEHGGNFIEAARALKAQGYGAQGPRFTTAKLAGETVDVATPEAEVGDKDRAIAELRMRLVEAERRDQRRAEEWATLGQWLSKEDINPADRIIIYKLAAEHSWRKQQGEEEDGYTLLRLGETNRAARARVAKEVGTDAVADAAGYGLARACGLDAKTVSKGVKKYAEEWGILGRQERRGRAEDGTPRSDILVRLAADRVADVLVDLADFVPEKARNHGGKREPCPRCGSTRTRTVTYCGDCDLVLKETIRDDDEPADLAVAEAGNIPPTPVAVPAPQASYPPGEVTYSRTIDPPKAHTARAREDDAGGRGVRAHERHTTVGPDEERDDWDPYECNQLGCVRPVVIGSRWCGEHRKTHELRPPPASPRPAPESWPADVPPLRGEIRQTPNGPIERLL